MLLCRIGGLHIARKMLNQAVSCGIHSAVVGRTGLGAEELQISVAASLSKQGHNLWDEGCQFTDPNVRTIPKAKVRLQFVMEHPADM